MSLVSWTGSGVNCVVHHGVFKPSLGEQADMAEYTFGRSGELTPRYRDDHLETNGLAVAESALAMAPSSPRGLFQAFPR